jgi:glyoxylase-like metal-dependent hydrolase (beta-lactamase superfamily II)
MIDSHCRTCRAIAALVAIVFAATDRTHADEPAWHPVVPGVFRSAGFPCGYALVDGRAALLIGAPRGVSLPALKAHGVERCELVLLTHHDRDSCAQAGDLAAAGVPIRAPLKAEALLKPDLVRSYWITALPAETPGRWPPLFERSWNRWSFHVHPTGIDGVRCDLEDGQSVTWHDWTIEVLAIPGHSADQVALLARKKDGKLIAFCSDALCRPGKIWAPYSTDIDHVYDDGQKAAANSLDSLAARKPDILCPEHGPPILQDVPAVLTETAKAVRRVAFLKYYERFTKQEIGNPPAVAFLAKEQVATANPQGNPKPWTKISPHLYLTGQTYAVASKDGPIILMDPYAEQLPQRVEELRKDHGIGPVEAVMISHGHNDHYTGVFSLPKRDSYQVWTLDRTAAVIGNPRRFRAPFVDARPVKVDRPMKDGETVTWREYRLKFHHLPGQTTFAMGVEIEIDGKKCLFTGDNFYNPDQYTGSGGWSGMNRGLPSGYARSIQKVIDIKPDWVLAEHGGAFTFNAEDFRRRLRWAEETVKAVDALSPSGNHIDDWDPHRIRVEPLWQEAIPGRTVRVQVVVGNPSKVERTYRLRFTRPDVAQARELSVTVPPGMERREDVELTVNARLGKGRHVIPCMATLGAEEDGSDALCILDVE